MRGVRWREGAVDVLRSTPGRDKEVHCNAWKRDAGLTKES